MGRTFRSVLGWSLVSALSLSASSAFAQEAPATPAPPAPPTTPIPSPLGTAPAIPAAEADAHRVPTTIDAGPDKNAVIERRVTTETASGRVAIVLPIRLENEKWEQVCVAPCQATLDRFSTYRVAHQNGISSSGEFTLPPNSPSLQLQVDPGNQIVHHVGVRLTALGSAAAIAGGVLIASASKFDAEDDVRVAGFITSGAGVLFLAVGIPMMIASFSHVSSNGKRLAEAEPAKAFAPKLTSSGVVF